jgi:uncharacterized protein YkwD
MKRILKRGIVFMAVFLAMLFPATVLAASVPVSTTGTYRYDVAYRVAQLVNVERANQTAIDGIARPALTVDTDLMDAAMLRAVETSAYFSHTRPDGSSCYTASSKISGENIAYRGMADTAEEAATAIVTQWMNSPGHKANILSPSYTTIGVGMYVPQYRDPVTGELSSGALYGVQDFGTGVAAADTAKTNVTKATTINVDATVAAVYISSDDTIDATESVPLTVKIGGGAQIDATGATWVSSNPAVMTVSSSGVATGVSQGSATVTVTLPQRHDSEQDHNRRSI